MSKQEPDKIPTPDESTTSDSESDSESSDLAEDTSDTDREVDDNEPFRFILGDEAQARSLDGIAYGIDKTGQYFVICKDGDRVSGLLVHALIERNVEDGILLPISIPTTKATGDSKDVQ
ncbi:hypothetical protein HA402_013665 [Bradysia odoriphaga]|nr:hypothetical protein HA402_013665 [Bradysia odoriphaga]